MNLRDFVIQRLDEGGNISVNGISAEKVYFSDLGISDFRSKFFELFKELNKIFYKKYREYLWEDLNDIKTGFSYNGSTSFIFDAKVMTSPVSPQPKQVKILFLRSIENDGVFSL